MEEELTIMSEDKAKTENMAEDIAAAETDLKESKKKPKKTKEQKKYTGSES